MEGGGQVKLYPLIADSLSFRLQRYTVQKFEKLSETLIPSVAECDAYKSRLPCINFLCSQRAHTSKNFRLRRVLSSA